MSKITRSCVKASTARISQTQVRHPRFALSYITAHNDMTRRILTWKRFFVLLASFWYGTCLFITETYAAYQRKMHECPTQVSQWLNQCTRDVPQELTREIKSCFEGLTQEELKTVRTILLRRFQMAEFFLLCQGGTLKNFKEILVFLKVYRNYNEKNSPAITQALNQFDATLAKTKECPFSTITLFIEKFADTFEKIQELAELFQETCENTGFQAIREGLDIGEAIIQLSEGAQTVRVKPRQPFLQEKDLDAIPFLGIDNALILFTSRIAKAQDILAVGHNFSAFNVHEQDIKKTEEGLERIEKKINELEEYFSQETWRQLIEQIFCFPDAYFSARTTAVLTNQADRFLQAALNQDDRRVLYPFHLMLQALESDTKKKLRNQYAAALKIFIEYSTVIEHIEQIVAKIKTQWKEKCEMPLAIQHEESLWALGDKKSQEVLPVIEQSTNKNQKKLITLVRYYLSLLKIRMKTVEEYKEGGTHLKGSFGNQPIMPQAALYYFCFLRSILTGQNELFQLRSDIDLLRHTYRLVATLLHEEQKKDGNEHTGQHWDDLASSFQLEWKDVSPKQAKKQSHRPRKPRRKPKRKSRR